MSQHEEGEPLTSLQGNDNQDDSVYGLNLNDFGENNLSEADPEDDMS